MAYVIGSDKGKKKAESMKTGEKWTATDGSTWTKKSDGSVSVSYKGQTYDNAYKSTGGGTSGGSSRGSSSGGINVSGGLTGSYVPTGSLVSSNKYSPTNSIVGTNSAGNNKPSYTAPTLGSTWNANTDYQAIINEAIANGDYQTAAKAEQLRNQKIIYGNYIDGIDYGTFGKTQMANGASWEDIQAILDKRTNKALNTEGLEDFAYDDTYMQMYNYIQNLKNSETEAKIRADYEQLLAQLEQGKPEEYQSKYDPQIDALLNKILNREDFSYDVMNDPLYQQYAQMYQREGDRAMKETLAEVAAGAGGMNSYAVTAAQQANSYYGSMLNDKIPELYQLAYNMYLNDKESMVQDLGILQNMDATQYGRYRDAMNDYYNDKTFAYGAYNDAIQQGNWQKTFDYNSNWDNINFMNNNYLTNREWDATQSDKELENTRYDESTAKEEVWKYISLGVMPSADLIAKAGMTDTDVRLAVEAVKAENAKTSSGKSSSKNYEDEDYEDDDDNGGTVDDKASIYQSVYAGASELKNNGNKKGAKNYIQEAVANGYITQKEADIMKMKLFLW